MRILAFFTWLLLSAAASEKLAPRVEQASLSRLAESTKRSMPHTQAAEHLKEKNDRLQEAVQTYFSDYERYDSLEAFRLWGPCW